MPKDFHYQIIQIGYTKFFNADDDSTWCNGQTFGKRPFSLSPPKLSLDLRKKLNTLSDDFNTRLYSHLLGYAFHKLNEPDREQQGWLVQRIWYAQYDSAKTNLFNSHKFCEPGVEDSKFQDPSTWLFGVWGKQNDAPATASDFSQIDASSCASDAKYDDDDIFAWDCDMAVYYASPGANKTATTITGLDFVRSFHPKTAGFEAIKTYLANAITKVRKVPSIAECIPAPGPDIDDISSTSSGFPSSLCATATGVSGYANSLGASATPIAVSGNAIDSLGASATNTATPTVVSGNAVDSLGASATDTSTAPGSTSTCNSKCDCNEDGCTSDSPACCANGTCDDSC